MLEAKLGDLAAMTTEELLRRRAELAADIPIIAAQLQDKGRRPAIAEDDSAEWESYRAWRGRARWALAQHKHDLMLLKGFLRERVDTSTAERNRRLAEERPSEADLAFEERGRRLRETLQDQGDEALLLRAWRVLRHLLPSGDELPESLDAADRESLALIGIRLRHAYGKTHLRSFVYDDYEPTPPRGAEASP